MKQSKYRLLILIAKVVIVGGLSAKAIRLRHQKHFGKVDLVQWLLVGNITIVNTLSHYVALRGPVLRSDSPIHFRVFPDDLPRKLHKLPWLQCFN